VSQVLFLLLAGWGLLNALKLWAMGLQIELLQQLIAGVQIPQEELQANDSRQILIELGLLGLLLVTAICFLRWTYLVNSNAHALGAVGMTITPEWAVAWYFIPILNLFMPYKAMDETFRASHPDYGPNDWKQAPRPLIVPLWWLAWVVGNFGLAMVATVIGAVAAANQAQAPQRMQPAPQGQAVQPVQPAPQVQPQWPGQPVPPALQVQPNGPGQVGPLVPQVQLNGPGQAGPPMPKFPVPPPFPPPPRPMPPAPQQQPAPPAQPGVQPPDFQLLLVASWLDLVGAIFGILQTFAVMSLITSLQQWQTAKYHKLMQQVEEEEYYDAELAEGEESTPQGEGIPVIQPVQRGTGVREMSRGTSVSVIADDGASPQVEGRMRGGSVYGTTVPPRGGQGAGAPSSADPELFWLLPVGRSGWAIAAGYLGLISVLILPGPLALLCGILALRDIRRHPNKGGMGRAIFGLVMGGLATGLLALVLIASVIQELKG
jgi:hypothetical protein